MIPAFFSALQDHSIRGHAREVYVWLHEHLDVVQYRPVKHSAVEQALSIEHVAVKRSIDRLVDAGYLDRGPRDGRLWTYRLFYSKPLIPGDDVGRGQM